MGHDLPPLPPVPPLSPSGDQLEIEGGGYTAVVTESGAALRSLRHDGHDLVDGFGADEMPYGGRGQVLMPWPNRIRDGRYSFGGADLQLPLTEPQRHHASHGLARWVAWTPGGRTASSVEMHYRLMAQTGYPWTLDLRVRYALSDDGLTVTQSATNRSTTAAPYASGAHPYLSVGPGPVDTWELTLPAATRSLTDETKIPVGREPVAGTPHDFRVARPLGDVGLDTAFTDLERDDGVATVVLRDPASGRGVALWAGDGVRWLQLFTADDAAPGLARRSLAVEPMTADADAFRTGEDLLTLAPGASVSVVWGVRAVQQGP